MRTTYCPNCKDTVRYYTDYGQGKSWLRICTDCETDLNYNYKLCILAAGQGTRSKGIEGLHKALLPLENKPVISHILDNYDERIEVVVAVGYQKEQIINYLNEVHSNRKITYVEVDNFDGQGAGPGYSLLCCKDELQGPFIYTAVDTIVEKPEDSEVFSFVGENWIGVASVRVEESSNYCLVKLDNDIIRGQGEYLTDLYYGKGNRAYIGLAGIAEYEKFWTSLEQRDNGTASHTDDLHEYNADSGFRGLDFVRIFNFKWYDTGNTKSYNEVRKLFPKEVVANKSDEALFIDNNKVTKYFSDSNKTKIRVSRLKHMNNDSLKVRRIHPNMYSYDFIEGRLLSEVNETEVFTKFLNWYNSSDGLVTKEEETEKFYLDCKEMYETKTINRLSKMKGTELDNIKTINGVDVQPIDELLKDIDWNKIYKTATPSKFHGDLQLENIIYQDDGNFTLIDWRQSFGTSQIVGDIYYDLGKIWHSLPINGKTILNENYKVKYDKDSAEVEYYFKSNLLKFYFKLELFCRDNGFNWDNVTLIGILHYLNICTLYDDFQGGEYGKFLFLLGKLMLTKAKRGENVL
jgi:NDP-sugar pyrophosphorylase family protein